MTTEDKIKCLENKIANLRDTICTKEGELKDLKEQFKEEIFKPVLDRHYHYIRPTGEIEVCTENGDKFCEGCYETGNYCRDGEIMKKRAEHETLSRLIWRWQKINDTIKIDEYDDDRYMIVRNNTNGIYSARRVDHYSYSIEATLFTSEEKALECIEKVIKPYILFGKIS